MKDEIVQGAVTPHQRKCMRRTLRSHPQKHKIVRRSRLLRARTSPSLRLADWKKSHSSMMDWTTEVLAMHVSGAVMTMGRAGELRALGPTFILINLLLLVLKGFLQMLSLRRKLHNVRSRSMKTALLRNSFQ